jgi:hypothetical protein
MTALWCALVAMAMAQEPAEPSPATDLAVEVEPGVADEEAAAVAPEPEPEPDPWPQRWPGQVTSDNEHYDLELLYAEGRFDEGLIAARDKLVRDPQDKDLYWLIIRFMYEQGERFQRTDTTIDKEAHYEEMANLADKGLALAPGDPHLLFARGLAKGRLGTTRGVFASLFMAKDIERDWLTSAGSGFAYASLDGKEHLPCDTYLGLAVYYRLVPDLWVVQMIAGTRGSPVTSLEYAQKADQCAPNRIRNLKELGVSQLCLGDKSKDDSLIEQGIATLGRIAGLRAQADTEVVDKQHAKMLIANPDLACEYSRDGQQDLDESKLKK